MENRVISAEGDGSTLCSEDVIEGSSPISDVEALLEDWGIEGRS